MQGKQLFIIFADYKPTEMSSRKEEIQQNRAQQEADIVQCLKTLSAGGLILYPTDTVWGIGCDATNEEAVKRVYQLKQRDEKIPQNLHGNSIQSHWLTSKSCMSRSILPETQWKTATEELMS